MHPPITSSKVSLASDEDWGIPADPANGILAFVPYSDALQERVEGGRQYGTVDLGCTRGQNAARFSVKPDVTQTAVPWICAFSVYPDTPLATQG